MRSGRLPSLGLFAAGVLVGLWLAWGDGERAAARADTRVAVEWALEPGAPLFTAAGRDFGGRTKAGLSGPATDRAVAGDWVAALPDDAFLTFSIDFGEWSRVDAHGEAQRLSGSRQLPDAPVAVATGSDGSVVTAADGGVVRLTPDGSVTEVWPTGEEQPGTGIGPHGLAVRSDGAVLIADRNHGRVVSVRDGILSSVAAIREPNAVAAAADGALLVAQAGERAVVYHVDAAGHVLAVAGGGKRDTQWGCIKAGAPARALRLNEPALVALPDGSFLIVLAYAIYHVDGNGRAAPIACSQGDEPVGFRDVYWDGRRARAVNLPIAGAAVTTDGGLLIATDRHVAVVPPRGGGRRLGAALPFDNLTRVSARRAVVHLTHSAEIALSVRRRGGRQVALINAKLTAGRHELKLPRKLGRGVHRLGLIARTPEGHVAIDRLAVLGQHRLELGLIRRTLRDFSWGETGLSVETCRRKSKTRARCRLAVSDASGVIDHTNVTVRLRRDGLLQMRMPPNENPDYPDGERIVLEFV